MRLTSVTALNFLAVPALRIDLDRRLSVLTGRNNIGKSTALAVAQLVKAAVGAAAAGSQLEQLTTDWSDCGHNGCQEFEVRLGLAFDDERELLDCFLRAAYLPLLHWPPVGDGQALSQAVFQRLGEAPSDPLAAGELVVKFNRQHRDRWAAGWEFSLPHGVVHIGLLGPTVGDIVDGPTSHTRPAVKRTGSFGTSSADLPEKVAAGNIELELAQLLPGNSFEFCVKPSGAGREPADIARIIRVAPPPNRYSPRDRISFAPLLHSILSKKLLVTPNHRVPPRTYLHLEELVEEHDLSDGAGLAAQLHRLKNGTAPMRQQFATAQQLFQSLTGQWFDSSARMVEPAVSERPGSPEGTTLVTPVIRATGEDGRDFDIPLRRTGAGDVEALYLAAVLSDSDAVLMLDEPAVHLSPTAQRKLLALLREASRAHQVIMVTHNPDLVPVSDVEDLRSIIRLDRDADTVRANHLPADVLLEPSRALRLLATSAVRSVLFAAGVLLLEGETDDGLIGTWVNAGLRRDGMPLPTSEQVNIAFVSVDGEKSFGPVIDLLAALNVPYAVLADGPSLRPTSHLALSLKKHTDEVPTEATSIDDVRKPWAGLGVFSLAEEFGDDGSKAGEIEAFMERTDSTEFAAVRRAVKASKGRRVGAAFAANVAAPDRVVELWAQVLGHLGLGDNATPGL